MNRKPYEVKAHLQEGTDEYNVEGLAGSSITMKSSVFETLYQPNSNIPGRYESKEQCTELHEIYTQLGYQQVARLLEGSQLIYHCWVHGIYQDYPDNIHGCPMCASRNVNADGYTATDSVLENEYNLPKSTMALMIQG